MNDCSKLMPEWLNFMKDLVGSEHLLLNLFEEQSLEDIKLDLMVLKECVARLRACCA